MVARWQNRSLIRNASKVKRVIYIASIDRKKEERLAIGSGPAWSPNGMEIAYTVKAGQDRWEIHILNVHTRKTESVFSTQGDAHVDGLYSGVVSRRRQTCVFLAT